MAALTASSPHTEKFEAIIQKNMPKLQMLPTVAVEALELVKQPECPVSEFASVVERDVTLASNMLKIANNPVHSRKRKILNLQEAVVRLGFRECKNLIMSSCVSTLTKKLSFEEEWIRDLLWRHSLYTAAIAHHINRRFHLGYQGEEFTAGLLHDLGRFLFASLFSDEFLKVDRLDFSERESPEHHEVENLEISHTEFAGIFAAVNNLPDELSAVMKWHHRPEQATEYRQLVSLIAVADDMANHLQRTGDSANYDAKSSLAVESLRSCMQSAELNRFDEFAESLIKEAAEDMHSTNAI